MNPKIEEALRAGLIQGGEFWFGLQGYSKYLVGAHGEVISLVKKPKKLKPIFFGEYLGVQLSDDDCVIRKKYLHQLVAETVLGPRPDGMECCHRDNNKLNNDISNLRWDTRKGNFSDNPYRPEINSQAKLTWEAVREIRMRLASGESQASVSNDTGTSQMTISRIARNISWRE